MVTFRRTADDYHLVLGRLAQFGTSTSITAFPRGRRDDDPSNESRMSDVLLEAYIRQRIAQHDELEVNIAWHGGEPAIMGLALFQRTMRLVAGYRTRRQKIPHSIRINGILIDGEWSAFLKEHSFLVGINSDGMQQIHALNWVDNRGQGAFDLVIQAWLLLRHYGVDVNVLCAINAANADHPPKVYRVFRDEFQAAIVRFGPVVKHVSEEAFPTASKDRRWKTGNVQRLPLQCGGLVTECSVKAEQFGCFLCEISDEWVKRDVGKDFVQTFDVAPGTWLGKHSSYIFSLTCGGALALDHVGDLYSCDCFVEPDDFCQNKLESLPNYCLICEVLFACYGECPRIGRILTPDGESGLNCLCAGHRIVISYITPPMKAMARLLRDGRHIDEIVQMDHVSIAAFGVG